MIKGTWRATNRSDITQKVHYGSVGSPVISKRNILDGEIERCVFSFPRRKKIIEEDEDEEKETQRRKFDEHNPSQTRRIMGERGNIQ